MSPSYFRTKQMERGGPFHCFNCGKKLTIKVTGTEYELRLKCPRCKTYFFIKCNEKIPFIKPKEQIPDAQRRDIIVPR